MCILACKERYIHGFLDEKLLANINMNTQLHTSIYSCIRNLASADSYIHVQTLYTCILR